MVSAECVVLSVWWYVLIVMSSLYDSHNMLCGWWRVALCATHGYAWLTLGLQAVSVPLLSETVWKMEPRFTIKCTMGPNGT